MVSCIASGSRPGGYRDRTCVLSACLTSRRSGLGTEVPATGEPRWAAQRERAIRSCGTRAFRPCGVGSRGPADDDEGQAVAVMPRRSALVQHPQLRARLGYGITADRCGSWSHGEAVTTEGRNQNLDAP